MAGEPLPRRRLGRRMRLKQSRDFARVRRLGRRQPCGCFIANWQVLPPGSPTHLGVITAKAIGNAVVRARARRLLREVFRLHQHDLAQPVDFVLVAQRSIVGKQLGGVEEVFMAMLRKSGLLKTE
ncbi:MAG TPA: ribonuclease P protein component [Verrucomicrobiae bacterium]|jgi:ribonuclease P protein component|nr:ribonuclease P protein component [Verrucomicrobiae bacterium]